MTIDCAFFGFLAGDAEARTSSAGKPWVRLRVGVGSGEAVQWVSVAVFGKAAEAVAELKKADRVYVEGTISLNTWRSQDGTEKHGLSVAAFKCEPTHKIGRNRPKAAEGEHKAAAAGRRDSVKSSGSAVDPALNDAIPF